MKNKKILSCLLGALVALNISACGISEEIKNIQDENNEVKVEEENTIKIDEKAEEVEKIKTPTFGGEVKLPITYVKTLNPLINTDKSNYYFGKLMFEGLFEFNENLEPVPVLAESYVLSEDGRELTIELKNGVKWHDGKDFNARDVEFTINALKYAGENTAYKKMIQSIYKPARASDIQNIIKVNVLSDNKIKLRFNKSYANRLESLIFPIVPKHVFTAKSSTIRKAYQNALNQEFDFTPIGTGPYKFERLTPLKEIELKANENWWKERPFVETVKGIILEDDELAVISFEAGNVDAARAQTVDWEKYAENDKIKMHEYTTQEYEFLGFNFKNKVINSVAGKNIRKAIAYSIDKSEIIKTVYLGHAEEVDLPLNPNSWLNNKEKTYEYNKVEAKNLLKEAGYEDKDQDGIVENEKGKKLTLRLLTNTENEIRRLTAEMIKEDLFEVGIEIKIEDVKTDSKGTQWEKINQKLSKKDFDIALLGWEMSYVPDMSFAFHSANIYSGSNFINYANADMDALLKATFEATNKENKKLAYTNLNNYVLEELPYVSLYFKNKSMLINKEIYGDVKPKSFNIYDEFETWFR